MSHFIKLQCHVTDFGLLFRTEIICLTDLSTWISFGYISHFKMIIPASLPFLCYPSHYCIIDDILRGKKPKTTTENTISKYYACTKKKNKHPGNQKIQQYSLSIILKLYTVFRPESLLTAQQPYLLPLSSFSFYSLCSSSFCCFNFLCQVSLTQLGFWQFFLTLCNLQYVIFFAV